MTELTINTNEIRDNVEYLPQDDYLNNTFELVNPLIYLTGVSEEHFLRDDQVECREKLSKNKEARIIRNLCMLRTAIEKYYHEINQQIYFSVINLDKLPKYVPQQCIKTLKEDGIDIIKSNCKVNEYLITINGLIANHINNCKTFFPIWLNWNYVKDLFIIPNGLKEAGVKKAAETYYANKNDYPYQVFINWNGRECGNLFLNDEKFVDLVYKVHGDIFWDRSKVKNVSDMTKQKIYDFLEESQRTCIIVDCENSDPYKLYAVLNNLDTEALLSRIYKIILCDDVHTTSAWDMLNRFTDIPMEHIETRRVTEHKSIVDPVVAMKVCQEYYESNADSVILFGSDSDYWALYGNFKKVNYYVMVESSKFGCENREALLESGIPFCYIDNFCTGNSNKIKTDSLLFELNKSLEKCISLNVNDILDNAFTVTRAQMSDAEKRQFIQRYIKNIHLVVDKDGSAKLSLGE